MHKAKYVILCLLILLNAEILFGGTIHGFVREKANQEPIIMGNVWIKGTTIGTTTNMKGYYVLPSLPAGNYEIYFRYIGFKTEKFTKFIGPNDDITQDIYLEIEAIEMEETVIEAERNKRDLDITPSQITMQARQLREMPQVAEPDLFRALQMLPGVATLSDFSAGLYIRGGSADQNLILLDGIDVYNPNHMFGFFSSFSTDAIKSVELFKGGYPTRYGGRLSSVLDVVNKEGNREEFEGVARLSILSASTTLEGPWKYGSWMISGRRTYLDLVTKIADIDLPYYFWDGHAKINFDIDRNNQASLSFYAGNDVLDYESETMDMGLSWGNKTFSAQWTHLFSSKIFSHFIVAGSRFDSDTKVKFEDVTFGMFNEVTDIAVKGQLSYTPSLIHSIDIGFEAKMLDFDLNQEVVGTKYPNSFSGNYYSLFMQDNFKLGNLNIVQAGLRFDYYTDGDYANFSPQISYKRILTSTNNLTFTYGRYTQFLNLVQEEGMSFADMWFPVDKTFNAGKSDHYIIGYNYDPQENYSISIEAYYKDLKNIAEFKSWNNRPRNEDIGNQTAAMNFYQGNGKAYGLDVILNNNIWGFKGWLGFSFCKTFKTVNGLDSNFEFMGPEGPVNYLIVNQGKEYYPTYDRRNTITAMQDYQLSRKWKLNFAFKFGSGQPYTEATDRYAYKDLNGEYHSFALKGEKNTYRLPAYHRLDIGAFYSFRMFGKWDSEFYVQVINIYNNKNVWFRRWDMTKNPATQKDVNMLPLLPTLGINIKF